MANNNQIKVSIGLDGNAKFNSALRTMDAELKKLSTEMRAVTTAFDKNNITMADLKLTEQTLNNLIDQQVKKINLLKEAIKQNTAEYNANKTLLAQVTKEYGANSDAANKVKQVLAQQEKTINDYSIKLNNATTYLNKYTSDLQKNQQQMDALNKENNKGFTELSGIGNIVSGLSSKFSSLKDTVAQAKSPMVAVAAISFKVAKAGAEALFKVLTNIAKVSFSVLKASIEGVVTALSKITTASITALNTAVTTSISGFEKYAETIGTVVSKISELSVTTGSSFTAQMSTVQSLMGYTDGTEEQMAKMDELEDLAKELNATTTYTATDVGKAYQYEAQAGWKVEEMLEATTSIMNLNTISTTNASMASTNLATTSDIVTDAITSFGYTAEDTAQFVDVMAATITNSNTNVEDMGDAFKYIGSVANQLNYSVEDVSLGIGLLANNGIKGSQAGTALRTGLLRLASPTEDAAKVMDDLGISLVNADGETASFKETLDILRDAFSSLDGLNLYDDEGSLKDFETLEEELQGSTAELEAFQKAGDLFGTRQVSTWLALINSTTEDYNKLYDAISSSEGMAQEMADTKIDNLTGEFELLKSAVSSVGLAIFEGVETPLRDLTTSITPYVTQISDAISNGLSFSTIGISVEGLINDVGSQIEALLPQLTTAFNGITSVSNTAMLGILENILSLMPNVFSQGLPTLIVQFWDFVNSFIDQVTNAAPELVAGASNTIMAFCNGMTSAASNVQDSLPTIIESLSSGIDTVLPSVLTMGSTVLKTIASGILKMLPTIAKTGVSVVQFLADAFKDAPESMDALFTSLHDALSTNFPALLESVLTIFNEIVSALTSQDGVTEITGFVRMIVDDLAATFVELLPGVVTLITSLGSSILDPILNMLVNSDVIEAFVNSLVDLVVAAVDWLGANAESITSVLVNLIITLVNAITDNMDTLIPALTSVITGIVDAISGNLSELLTAALQMIGALITALTEPGCLDELLNCATNLVSDILFAIIDNLDVLIDALTQTVIALIDILAEPSNLEAIVECLSELINDVIAAIPALLVAIFGSCGAYLSDMVQAFKDWIVTGKWKEIGSAILDGIVNGIEDAIDKAGEVISNVGSRLTQAFKDVFGIESPSKVFKKEIGSWLMPGVTEGIDDSIPETTKDVQKSVDKMMTDIDFGGTIGTMTTNLNTDGIKMSLAPNNVSTLISANGSDILPSTQQSLDNSTTNNYQNLFSGATINVTINSDDDIESFAEKLQFYMDNAKRGVGIA